MKKKLILFFLIFVFNVANAQSFVFPSISKLSDLSSESLFPYLDAFSFSVSGSGTEIHDYKIPTNMFVVAAEGIFSGQVAGDYLIISVIDKDNVLGLGENIVLSTPVNKYFITPTNNIKEKIELGYPNKAIKDLYVRFSYTTTNVLANVNVRFNIIAHKVLGQ